MATKNIMHTINSNPFGVSYEEWTQKWWKWLVSIPECENPAYDTTGKYAYEKQSDPNVFFLCQTIEGKIEGSYCNPVRSITVGRNQSIFMPIINWISIEGVDGDDDDELTRVAKEKIDEVLSLDFTINGVPLNGDRHNFRSRTEPFDLYLDKVNIFGHSLDRSGIRRAVSDGFWIFLKPLTGRTTLSSNGACSTGATKIEVTYVIDVLPN